jgi:predicted Rossmann-fold nucleotide-binding protein
VPSNNVRRTSGRRASGSGSSCPSSRRSTPFVQEAFEHQTFSTRLHHFVLLSDAYVVVPDGIGTVLEAMLVWQLLQVRHLHDTPLIFVGDMWAELVTWAQRYTLRPGFELANLEDMAIPRCVKTADEAIAALRRHHARWRLAQEGRA